MHNLRFHEDFLVLNLMLFSAKNFAALQKLFHFLVVSKTPRYGQIRGIISERDERYSAYWEKFDMFTQMGMPTPVAET